MTWSACRRFSEPTLITSVHALVWLGVHRKNGLCAPASGFSTIAFPSPFSTARSRRLEYRLLSRSQPTLMLRLSSQPTAADARSLPLPESLHLSSALTHC